MKKSLIEHETNDIHKTTHFPQMNFSMVTWTEEFKLVVLEIYEFENSQKKNTSRCFAQFRNLEIPIQEQIQKQFERRVL